MQQHSKLDTVDEKYQRTLVYGIICLITGEMYVGSTCETLDTRIRKHIQHRNCSAWQILERGNYKTYVIQHYPCNTKREMLVREGGWQRAYKASFGEKLVNERIEGCFKDDSPEALQVYNKEYYKEHKEKDNARSNKYYAEHKEKVKRPWTCDWCNKTMTTGSRHRHKKICKSKPTHT